MAEQKICYGCMTMQADEICPNCGYDRYQDVSPVYLRPGTILAQKYLIGKVIGHGGFGITYLAYDTVLGIKLAVKEYLVQEYASREPGGRIAAHAGESKDRFEEGISRFLEEARSLARFEGNPGIVSVRDFFRANGTAYLVMVYLEGMNLRQYLAEKGPMPYERVRQEILPVITGALTAVHGAGMLHRDISPDNIFLTKQGQVRIIDFGAARQVLSNARSMSIILKPGYAPEEQYRSRGRQGPWTDVYAVAATIYRAITGKVPPESLDRLANDTLEPPSRYCAIPSAEEKVLLKAMSVKAEIRYQSMLEFYNALLAASEEDGNVTLAYRNQRNMENTSRNPIPEQRRPVRPVQTEVTPRAPRRIEPDDYITGEITEEGGSGALKATANVIKIIIAITVIVGVIAVAFVLIKLMISAIATKIPDVTTSTTAPPDATSTPGVTDTGSGIGQTPDPGETDDPGETIAPILYPDVTGIIVESEFAYGEPVLDTAAFVPPSGREITYGVSSPVGNLIYLTAKPSHGNILVSRFIADPASLDQGKVEHFFGRDGALYMYAEDTKDVALIIPSEAMTGMTWTDCEGYKEIAETSATIYVRSAVYENCVVVRVDGLYYIAYQRGIGCVGIIGDYLENAESPIMRLRYNDDAGNMTSTLDAMSTDSALIE